MDTDITMEDVNQKTEETELNTDFHLSPYISYNDVFYHTFQFLGTGDLYNVKNVSKSWCEIGSSGELWNILCNQLWKDKVYIPEKFKKLKEQGSTEKAYKESFGDSTRDWLTKEELCSFEWNFRFKQAAGEHWVEQDRYWQGESPRTVRFFEDGTTTSNRGNYHRRWKFVDTSANKHGHTGKFIRTENTPTKIVSRHPNWGFYMQSCWTLFTTFPLPKPGEDSLLEDESLGINTDDQLSEVLAYNHGMSLETIQVAMQVFGQNLHGRRDVEDEDGHDDDAGEEEGGVVI